MDYSAQNKKLLGLENGKNNRKDRLHMIAGCEGLLSKREEILGKVLQDLREERTRNYTTMPQWRGILVKAMAKRKMIWRFQCNELVAEFLKIVIS